MYSQVLTEEGLVILWMVFEADKCLIAKVSKLPSFPETISSLTIDSSSKSKKLKKSKEKLILAISQWRSVNKLAQYVQMFT